MCLLDYISMGLVGLCKINMLITHSNQLLMNMLYNNIKPQESRA